MNNLGRREPEASKCKELQNRTVHYCSVILVHYTHVLDYRTISHKHTQLLHVN